MSRDNLLTVLQQHALIYPDNSAFSFLHARDVSQVVAELSYSELFLQADLLSQRIRGQATPGDRVALCYPAGLDFVVAFYACLMA